MITCVYKYAKASKQYPLIYTLKYHSLKKGICLKHLCLQSTTLMCICLFHANNNLRHVSFKIEIHF